MYGAVIPKAITVCFLHTILFYQQKHHKLLKDVTLGMEMFFDLLYLSK